MNDTTRDELIERVRVLLRGYLGSIGDCDAASGSVTTMLHIEKGAAADIIALIRADERGRIREALLSEGAKTAAGKNLYNNRVIELDQAGDDDWDILPWQDEWIEGAEDVLTAALDHIGLHGDETGGQG